MFLYEFTNTLPIKTLSGLIVASNYVRIVYGGRGAYVEFSFEQVFTHLLTKSITPHYYFVEYRTSDNIMAYFQKHKVSYADYLPNMFYISPVFLQNFERTQKRYRVVEV